MTTNVAETGFGELSTGLGSAAMACGLGSGRLGVWAFAASVTGILRFTAAFVFAVLPCDEGRTPGTAIVGAGNLAGDVCVSPTDSAEPMSISSKAQLTHCESPKGFNRFEMNENIRTPGRAGESRGL